MKTDRRDARRLALSLRSGELTPIWVPDDEAEAMRDLTRTREEFKHQQRRARQQLNAFVLRHGHHWPGNRTRWTQAHERWLESLEFAHDFQYVVLQEYLEAVRAASRRVADLDAQLERALPRWSMAPVVHALVALRGIDRLSAMVLLAELGDLRRFDSPRQTAHLKRKAAGAPAEAQAIAWQAQKRLCGRYRDLLHAGKNTKQTTVAVARELAGFVWAIARQTMPAAPAMS